MTSEKIHDSPQPWVAEHIRRFEETDGDARPGMSDLLLIMRGRKSGKLRRTALVYVRDDDQDAVVPGVRTGDREGGPRGDH